MAPASGSISEGSATVCLPALRVTQRPTSGTVRILACLWVKLDLVRLESVAWCECGWDAECTARIGHERPSLAL